MSFASTPRRASSSQYRRAAPCDAADLDSDQQAATADVRDARGAQSTHGGEQMVAELGGARSKVLVHEHGQRRAPDGRSERIAAERAAVIAGLEQRQQRAAREHRRDGIHAAAECLADHEHVGFRTELVLVREHPARAAEPRLDLVQHEQHAALAGTARARRQDSPAAA